MNTTCQVQQYIKKTPKGRPFTTTSFLKFGTRTAVDKALSRLAKEGEIVRVTQGVYVRPEQNRFVGQVLPEPFKIAEAIAKNTNEVIQVNGAEAARQFGFSTQVPAQTVFLTTGQTRRFSLGSREVTLKHVSKRKIPLSGSKIGLAILAMWYLGKQQVSIQTIEILQKKLSSQEFTKLTLSLQYMPAWMSNVVLQYQNARN